MKLHLEAVNSRETPLWLFFLFPNPFTSTLKTQTDQTLHFIFRALISLQLQRKTSTVQIFDKIINHYFYTSIY